LSESAEFKAYKNVNTVGVH